MHSRPKTSAILLSYKNKQSPCLHIPTTTTKVVIMDRYQVEPRLATVIPHRGATAVVFPNINEACKNLDLFVDSYCPRTFEWTLANIFNPTGNSKLRNLKIERATSMVGRVRSSVEMQRLLMAVLARSTVVNDNGSSYSLRTRPLALKSLQLEHVSESDILFLPDLLREHPSLIDFGISLWPYRSRHVSSALLKALKSMPKLQRLNLRVMQGTVLGEQSMPIQHSPITKAPGVFSRLKVLEVSLPCVEQVLSLTAYLADLEHVRCKHASGLVLQELYLKTDAMVGDVVHSIAKYIATTKALEELQLIFRSHPLDDDGCTVLAKALTKNQSISYVGLGPWLAPVTKKNEEKAKSCGSRRGITRTGGCAALVEMLQQNMTITSLTFQGGTWPGQETHEEENTTSDNSNSSAADSNSEHTEDFALGSNCSGRTSSFDSYLLRQKKQKDDAPAFPNIVSFCLGLNKCGRGQLMRKDTASTSKEDWIIMMAQETNHTSRIYYFLSNNPSFFTEGAR